MRSLKLRRGPVRRGFSLVELLVAIVILSLALISLSQLYLAGMWTTKKARYMSIATQRAQAEMEKAQDLGMLTLLNGPTNDSYDASEYQYNTDGRGVTFTEDNLPNGRGTVTWQPYPPGTNGNEHLLKLDIVISWDGRPVSQSQIHVTTLLTNRQ